MGRHHAKWWTSLLQGFPKRSSSPGHGGRVWPKQPGGDIGQNFKIGGEPMCKFFQDLCIFWLLWIPFVGLNGSKLVAKLTWNIFLDIYPLPWIGYFLYNRTQYKIFVGTSNGIISGNTITIIYFYETSPQKCYIGIDLDLSKPKGMPGLKLHSASASCSFSTKYINKAKALLWPEQVSTVKAW